MRTFDSLSNSGQWSVWSPLHGGRRTAFGNRCQPSAPAAPSFTPPTYSPPPPRPRPPPPRRFIKKAAFAVERLASPRLSNWKQSIAHSLTLPPISLSLSLSPSQSSSLPPSPLRPFIPSLFTGGRPPPATSRLREGRPCPLSPSPRRVLYHL